MAKRLRSIELNDYTPPPAAVPLPKRSTLISIDFDRTFTADRTLWRAFILGAVRSGHRVICVTGARETATNVALLRKSFGGRVFAELTTVIWCNHMPKRRTAELHGYKVDIWIDDVPEIIGATSRHEVQDFESRFPTTESLPIV